MKPTWPGIDRHLAFEEQDVEPPRPSSSPRASPDPPRPRPSLRRRPAEECRRRTQTVRALLPCDSSPVPSASSLTLLHVQPTRLTISSRKAVRRRNSRISAATRMTATMRTTTTTTMMVMDPTGDGLTRPPRRKAAAAAAGATKGLPHCRPQPSPGYYWQSGRMVFQGTNLQQVQVHQETAQDIIDRPR